jgi:hypothetical protein
MNILNKNKSMNAVIPLIDLSQRGARRKFIREASNIVEDLEMVNASFYFELFNNESKESYLSIYKRHLDWWQETIKELVRTHKFTTCAIDRLWFANNYKPQHYF